MEQPDGSWVLEDRDVRHIDVAVASDMERLMEQVKQWGRDKNINNPTMQFAKFIEESGEIAHELTRGNFQCLEMEDALGDTLVTLIILADILGYDLKECLQEAYDVISKRKGKTINGSFVKEQ